MADKPTLPKELLERIRAVKNKRARIVLDGIVEYGMVTTEQLSRVHGLDHPPRAAQDAKDLGFRIKKLNVKHSNGRSIAAYVFDEAELNLDKAGRRLLPKKERNALILAAGKKCQLCGATHNLQLDHRIPYEVAAETQRDESEPYQVLCGSCNSRKGKFCKHCLNWLNLKILNTCRSCYWASPDNYTHVAMQEERRIELVWIDTEVKAYERLEAEADRAGRSVSEQIKVTLAGAS